MLTRFAALLLVPLVGCSLIVESDARGVGIGAACAASGECHAGFCDNGLCVTACTHNADCPGASRCFAGKCQLPLTVAGLWVGFNTGGEGWTLTHQEGLKAATAQLPYVSWSYREGVLPFTGAISTSVDELVKAGSRVIIANSFSQRDEILKKADEYPNVTFLTCASYISNGRNAMSYTAHSEQAWYVAGKVAAAKTVKKRLGYIGSFITPEVVRHINAFLHGARSIDKDIVLEVSWLGFWYDYKEKAYEFSHPVLTGGRVEKVYREELLAYRLLEDGADVIAHGADNQRAVRLIERLDLDKRLLGYPVWSLSNDNRNGYRQVTADGLPNGAAMRTCIGSPYWEWGPMYKSLLDQIHRGTFKPVNINEPMSASPESPVGFQVNPTIGIDDSSVRLYVNDVSAAGWQSVFDGRYETTGQRDKDGDGVPDATQVFEKDEKMSDAEYRRMCWFAQGILERRDPTVPIASEVDAVVARVPDKSRLEDAKWLADIEGPPGAPPKVGLNCSENY